MAARRQRVAAALVAGSLALSCAGDPRAGGDPAWNPVRQFTETSEDQERDLGMKFDDEVSKHLALVDDPVVLAFVHDLGNEVLRRIPQQPFYYRFRVVQDPQLNAFAVPGGYVYLHTGTILAAGSVDELAGVMAHEIGHVKGRHYARMREKAAIPDLVAAVAGIGAAMATQHSGAAVAVQGANEALKLQFTRDFENEADQLGIDYMSRAGFEPTGMARFFERIVEAEKKRDVPGFRVPPYLFSHPEVEDRIVTVSTLGPRSRPQTPADPSYAIRLREVQARLSVLTDAKRRSMRQALAPRTPAGDAALAEANRYVAEGFSDRAIAALEAAESIAPADPRLPYRRAEILEQAGRSAEAIAAWRRTVDLDPQQAQVLYRLGLAYKLAGDPRNAVFYLDQAARRFGERSELRKEARFEAFKLTFRPFEKSGLADGSAAGEADTVAGSSRERFSRGDEKAVWWGRLNPRYSDHVDDLHARWRDPSGAVRREAPLDVLSKPIFVSEFPLRASDDVAAGDWSVEILLEDDVLERRSFAVVP